MIKKSSEYELILQLLGGICQSQYPNVYDFNCHIGLGAVKDTELQLRFPYIKLKSSENYTPDEKVELKKKNRPIGTIRAQENLSDQPWALD